MKINLFLLLINLKTSCLFLLTPHVVSYFTLMILMMMTLLAYIHIILKNEKEKGKIRKCFDINEEKFECGNKRNYAEKIFFCVTKATAIDEKKIAIKFLERRKRKIK